MEYVNAIIAKLKEEAKEYQYDMGTGHLWKPAKYRDFKKHEEPIYQHAIPGYKIYVCMVCSCKGLLPTVSWHNTYNDEVMQSRFFIYFKNINTSCKEIRLRNILI